MQMIVTTIRVRTSADNRREIMQTFHSLSGSIMNERGCKSWRVYREVGHEESVIVIQEWDSRSHWNAHLQSDKFAVMIGAMSLLRGPEAVDIRVLNQLDGSHSAETIRARNSKETR